MNRRWLILALVFAGIVISYIDRGNLGLAAPSIMREFRIDPGAMGVLLSAFFWTYAIFQIPAGALIDRVGIRRVYAAGFLIWSIASASIALSRGIGDIVGLRMLLGFAESVGPLASVSFIRKNFTAEERGLPTSIYLAGQSVGPALGALVGAALLDRFGWRTMFALTGLGALVWLPGWLAIVPSDQIAAPNPATQSAPSPVPAWRPLMSHPGVWALSLCILLASYYWFFVLTWLPSYMVISRGFSTTEMGHVISTGLFVMAACNILTGYAADRLAHRVGVFRVRLLFAAAGYAGTAIILLLLVVQDRAWVLPVFTLAMCATGTGNSSYWAIAQQISPKNLAGRTVGYLNTLSQVAGAGAPVITGWLLGPRSHFGPAILVAGVCPVLAAVCLLATGTDGLERTRALLAGETN